MVRATGGLDDTIDENTGFKFKPSTGEALLAAVRSALAAFGQKDLWKGMMKLGMGKDFSWSSLGRPVRRAVPASGRVNLSRPLIHQYFWRKETMAGQNILTFTDGSFEADVLNSEVPVLVDFWAEWCGPCRMMGPTVDAISDEFAGRLKVGKVNVDDNGNTAMKYRIQGIPTLLLFKSGKVVDMRVGAVGKSEVLKMIEPHVSNLVS